jgi:non-homologous end joining protein Ku
MKNTDLPETHKFIPAAEVLKSFKSSKDAFAPLSDIEKKIAKLEQEAAIRMAIDTFLDCSEVKVKVGRACKPRPSEKVINRYTAA